MLIISQNYSTAYLGLFFYFSHYSK